MEPIESCKYRAYIIIYLSKTKVAKFQTPAYKSIYSSYAVDSWKIKTEGRTIDAIYLSELIKIYDIVSIR